MVIPDYIGRISSSNDMILFIGVLMVVLDLFAVQDFIR